MNVASIIVLSIFIASMILVLTNFAMHPTKAKVVFRQNGYWYISLKRIWWDTCELRSAAQEYCRTTLPAEYPFVMKETADRIAKDINTFLEK